MQQIAALPSSSIFFDFIVSLSGWWSYAILDDVYISGRSYYISWKAVNSLASINGSETFLDLQRALRHSAKTVCGLPATLKPAVHPRASPEAIRTGSRIAVRHGC